MGPHINPPKDGSLVAFIGWNYFETRVRNLKSGKIHVGRINREVIRSLCRTHYPDNFSLGQYKIITSEENQERFCRFCSNDDPSIYAKLVTTPQPPDMFYILIHPAMNGRSGVDFVISKETSGSIRRRLINNPEFLRELKNNLRQTGNVKLLRAHFVGVDFKIREVVERITFKE